MAYTATGPGGRAFNSVTTVVPPDQQVGQEGPEATSLVLHYLSINIFSPLSCNTDTCIKSNKQAEGNVSLQNHASDANHFQQLEGRLEIGQVQVLIICAKELEVNAVLATLDTQYKMETIVKEHIFLFAGTFQGINVAILPLLQIGMVSSTADTSQVVSDLKPDAYIISAGICGGTGRDDDKEKPVHLGDVVISTDVGRYFDRVQGNELIHLMPDRKFGVHQRLERQIKMLKLGTSLSQFCRDADANLREVRERLSSGFFGVDAFPDLRTSTRPPADRTHQDRLYKEADPHMHQDQAACTSCNQEKKLICAQSATLSCEQTGCNDIPLGLLERGPPKERGPLPVHFGIFGSEDVVMRSANYTRTLLKARGIMAIDMESRGIWHAAGSHIPRDVVIIRGVSDYADSHKNDAWQPYAAMAAACTTKAFVVKFFQSTQ